MEHESGGDTNCNWCAQNSHQRVDKGTGRIENKRASGDHSNSRIIKIGQNTKKRPGDLRILAVIQNPVENY